MRPNTKVVYVESPGSLTFEVQDIPAIAAVAHRYGARVLMDNTWATGCLFRAFEHGVDVSIHAATKYIGGHSDIMLGAVVTNEESWLPVRSMIGDLGHCAGPDDIFFALRGMRTLSVRLERHQKNALEVARWLQTRPEVSRVLYPALPEDPGHAIVETRFSRRQRAVRGRAESRRRRRRSPPLSTRSICSASARAGAATRA